MTHRPHSFEVLREAQQSGRLVVVQGVRWLVYDLPPLTFDRRKTPSLVFESDNLIRRLRNFPAKWRGLSDKDLFALSRTR
jgi:hypothetical protein